MRFKTLSGGLFGRLLDGEMDNLNVTSRIHRCPQNTMSETRTATPGTPYPTLYK